MERTYRVLLIAYPKRFRQAYGEHMMQVFGDQCRETRRGSGATGLIKLALSTILDVMVTALRERGRTLGPIVSEAGGFRTEEHRRSFVLQAVQSLCMAAVMALALIVFPLYFPNSGDESGMPWLLLALVMSFWILGVPLTQYLLMRRLSGIRPKLGIELYGVPVFGIIKTRGHRFEKSDFALICAVPVLEAWLLAPLCLVLAYLVVGQFVGTAFTVLLIGMPMSVSVVFFWYTLLALLKPRGTLVEELEGGGVRFYEPVTGKRDS